MRAWRPPKKTWEPGKSEVGSLSTEPVAEFWASLCCVTLGRLLHSEPQSLHLGNERKGLDDH